MLKRRGLGILIALLLAGIGVLQDVQSFGVSTHDRVLDAVVDHLHEVASTIGATVQPTLLFWCVGAGAAGGAFDVARAWCD